MITSMNFNIPKIDDLINMSEILNNEFGKTIDLSLFEIIINVDDNTIKKINEDLYYRYNSDGSPEDVDEVNVRSNGIRFKYTNQTK